MSGVVRRGDATGLSGIRTFQEGQDRDRLLESATELTRGGVDEGRGVIGDINVSLQACG